MLLRRRGKPEEKPKDCPCLRDLSLDEGPKGLYCVVMGAKTLLEDFDLENKCGDGLYEACELYARYRRQESSRLPKRGRRRKTGYLARWSSVRGALRLFL